jgi:hypothetical protein
VEVDIYRRKLDLLPLPYDRYNMYVGSSSIYPERFAVADNNDIIIIVVLIVASHTMIIIFSIVHRLPLWSEKHKVPLEILPSRYQPTLSNTSFYRLGESKAGGGGSGEVGIQIDC